MEAKIQKQIIDYFSYFDEFNSTAKTTLRDCQNYAAAINKLIQRCKTVKEADVTGSPLENFEHLQTKLCAAVLNLITCEVEEIRHRQATLEDSYEKLSNKNKVLRDSCKEIDFNVKSSLITGTPIQPSLKQLLEYADDTITFASQTCAQIDAALNILSLKRFDTFALGEHFWYPIDWQRRIKEILLYTSFLSENQI